MKIYTFYPSVQKLIPFYIKIYTCFDKYLHIGINPYTPNRCICIQFWFITDVSRNDHTVY